MASKRSLLGSSARRGQAYALHRLGSSARTRERLRQPHGHVVWLWPIRAHARQQNVPSSRMWTDPRTIRTRADNRSSSISTRHQDHPLPSAAPRSVKSTHPRSDYPRSAACRLWLRPRVPQDVRFIRSARKVSPNISTRPSPKGPSAHAAEIEMADGICTTYGPSALATAPRPSSTHLRLTTTSVHPRTRGHGLPVGAWTSALRFIRRPAGSDCARRKRAWPDVRNIRARGNDTDGSVQFPTRVGPSTRVGCDKNMSPRCSDFGNRFTWSDRRDAKSDLFCAAQGRRCVGSCALSRCDHRRIRTRLGRRPCDSQS